MNQRFSLAVGLFLLASSAFTADKQILMIAGKPSHGPGQHEHNAGVLLLSKLLNTVPGIHITTSLSGAWPDANDFEKADAIFFFSDGGDNHFVFQGDHSEVVTKAAKRGAGLMFLHYATEPPAARGHQEMLDWAGGFFEINHSINPIYEADFKTFPKHEITQGVEPFKLKDEWYYNIRFRENVKGITNILVTIPPASTIGADGIRSGNPDVRTKIGQPQTVSWATVRANGGRSVGFTGSHFHANLGNDNFRKILLNSLVWISKSKVPSKGIDVKLGPSDLTDNLDSKPARPPAAKPAAK